MAVNKVEYKLASTTTGFAEAGDSVTIKNTNAKIIKKDVDEGCIEKLSNSTEKFLNVRLQHSNSSDETEYQGDSKDDSGIDDGELNGDSTTEGNSSEDENKDSGAPSGNGGSGNAFGPAILMATTALHPFMNSVSAPIVGAIDLALGASSIALASSFDDQYGERMSEASASSEYITEIQDYEEILNTDIETMTSTIEELEANKKEQEKSAEENTSETNSDKGALESLYAELEQAKADGDEEKIAEIQAQIDEITANLGEGTNDVEDPTTEIQLNNEGAHTTEEYNNQIAQFLSEGNNLGTLGVVNATSLVASAVNSQILSAEAFRGVNLFTLSSAIAGSIMTGIARNTFIASSTMMTVKATKEFNAGSKGKDLYSELNNMQDPLTQHDELVAQLIAKQEETAGETEGNSDSGSESGGSATSGGTESGSNAGSTSGTSSNGGSSSGGSSSSSGSSATA